MVGSSGGGMSEQAVVAHAVLMLAAWFYLVPAGIAVAVLKAFVGKHWMTYHKVFQVRKRPKIE